MALIKSPIGVSLAGQMTDQEFARVRKLIREFAGIDLNDSKRMLAFSRLRPRLRELGLPTFSEYLTRLERDKGAEVERFINALTTNLTSFYREPHHFDILARELQNFPRPKVRIWCAAASTGEEPYSIALCCRESLKPGVRAEILATDIDTKVLSTAREAEYAADALTTVPPKAARRWFDEKDGMVAVKRELRDMVRFQRLNLIEPRWLLRDTFDFIFCRNVLIYFSRDDKTNTVRRMHELMAPSGLLFVGHSENFSDCRDMFKLEGRTTYRRIP